MRRVGHRVNIIPVISKSDSMTSRELAAFKKRIMYEILFYQIPIYDFPSDPEQDHEDTIEENNQLRVHFVF